MQDVKDITIIGAGPTGLFGAFYAGMRGASCRLIDNLDQVGGQLTALYPEKYIFDVAGFPKVLAKDLVKGMAEQAFQFQQPVHLGEKVMDLKRDSQDGQPRFTIVTEREEYPSRTVLIAGGIGAFTPRKLPLKDADRWYGKGLHDRILDPKVFAGKRVLLVGGGDSAFDWAVNLQGIARFILMIHRRDGFRAHAATVRQVHELCAAGKMELRTFWELKAIHGGDAIEADYVGELCARDWGLWRTAKATIEQCKKNVADYQLQPAAVSLIAERLDLLWAQIEATPKTARWRMRNRVGDRMRWYNEPEENAQSK